MRDTSMVPLKSSKVVCKGVLSCRAAPLARAPRNDAVEVASPPVSDSFALVLMLVATKLYEAGDALAYASSSVMIAAVGGGLRYVRAAMVHIHGEAGCT